MEVTNLSQKEGELTDDAGWEQEYEDYLAEKQKKVEADSSSSVTKKDDESSWESQYAAHCAEKEAKLAKQDAKQIQNMKQEVQ